MPGKAGLGIVEPIELFSDGSHLTALEIGKPILIVPRRAELGEHRNDHQLATARYFGDSGLVQVASDVSELPSQLTLLESQGPSRAIGSYASESLLNRVKEFLLEP